MKSYSIIDQARWCFYLVTPNESLFEDVDQAPEYLVEVLPFLLLMIMIEAAVIGFKNYRINDAIVSNSSTIVFNMTKFFTKPPEVLMYIWFYEHFHVIELPWDSPYTWAFMFVGYDFAYYWLHRAMHEINILWAAHQVHHSSEELNLNTAVRQSMFHECFSWIFYVPMALFVRPSVFYVHSNFNLLFQFWLHTQLVGKLGPLEWFLNTPSHHRIHHARNREAIDKNYAGVFIIWDKMFGTFVPERDRSKLNYGLTHPLMSFDPWEVQFCHFKHIFRTIPTMPTLGGKLSVLFKGPGWGPGKPRLGLLTDIPECPPKREISYEPKIETSLTIYALVQMLFTISLMGYIDDTKWEWHLALVVLVVCQSLIAITTIAWVLMNKPNSMAYEIGRCIIVCVLSQVMAVVNISKLFNGHGAAQNEFALMIKMCLHGFAIFHFISAVFLMAIVSKRARALKIAAKYELSKEMITNENTDKSKQE